MKKIWASLLTIAMFLSLLPMQAEALGKFTDISDASTAQNVEVLSLMGVLGGRGDNVFDPNGYLTRAEFCKMVIQLQGRGDQVAKHVNRTIFPDVPAQHWASAYIALASHTEEGTPGLIHGLPDGTFAPDRSITYGEAVTILMRVLGYTDIDAKALWPQGYIDLAVEHKVSDGVRLGGDSAITRSQAAQLFVNVLRAKMKSGSALKTLGSETTLLSASATKGTLRTADGKTYVMVNPADTTILAGARGQVVLDGEKALSFLPSVGTGALSDAAVIVSADGSITEINSLTNGVYGYSLYKNGVRISQADIKRGDVATYNATAKAVTLCDTRVAVYYENCTPSPSAPISITVLGGTVFQVLPTARESLSKFKPGKTMVLQLAADGQVAGAVATGELGLSGNASAYVGSKKTQLICGGKLIELELKGTDTSALTGDVVRISQTGKNTWDMHLTAQRSQADGDLDLIARTLGTRQLSDDMVLLWGSELVDTNQTFEESVLDQDRIVYAHVNSAGKVDMVVITDKTVLYGRAIVTERTVTDPEFNTTSRLRTLAVENTSGTSDTLSSRFSARMGDFVEAHILGEKYTDVTVMKKLEAVPSNAWIGTTAVNYNSATYTVPTTTVQCYNKDNGLWFEDFEEAMAYGGTRNLYVSGNVVRVIEVYT